MYAIVEIGARQYNVTKDDTIDVCRQEVEVGKEVFLDKVLLVSKEKKVEFGQPFVKGAKVEAEVLKHFRGEKLVSYKYRRRKNSHWTKGHRQDLTQLKIKAISLGL